MSFIFLSAVLSLQLTSCMAATRQEACPRPSGVTLQILGSGGPIADDARASSSYLIWVDGRSRALIDAGGGSFLRLGESGARFEDIDFFGLSHFHADHAADFPAILKSGFFSDRSRAIVVAGPDSGGPFPGLRAYLDAQFDPDAGAYAYLSGYLGGQRNFPELKAVEVSTNETLPLSVFTSDDGDLTVDALPVPHGIVPAVAFRVHVKGKTLVFTSDQNGSSDALWKFAENADVLVTHLVIPENAGGGVRSLHATPSEIAAMASQARPQKLLLSHFMARSMQDPSQGIRIVEDQYDGEVLAAADLMCIALD